MADIPDLKNQPPWYESNLFWGPLASAGGIILTVVAAMTHDLRWLLWFAWPCFGVAIWWLARRTRAVVLVSVLGIVLTGAGLLWLNRWLQPEQISAVAPTPKPMEPSTGQMVPPQPKPISPPRYVTKTTPPLGPVGLKGLSNLELKSQALSMVAAIGTIEHQYETENSAAMRRPTDPVNMQAENTRWLFVMEQVHNNEQVRWDPLRVQCDLLVEEMRSRIPADALPKDKIVLNTVEMALGGGLAGVYPLRTLSDYVEKLALLLPQPLTKPKQQ